jgi:hypothetical protein
MADILTSPINFLGATVLSINSSLGFGAQESTLSVDLIEDCSLNQVFTPRDTSTGVKVGDPVYFTTKQGGSNIGFDFGGILMSWNKTQNDSGLTYNAKVSDPRSLLENVTIIVDSYLGPPIQTNNYFNVYAWWESNVLAASCADYGSSSSSERGMPYSKIIQALEDMDPTIYTPTGSALKIDFTSFPQNLPEYYRVPGPSISILQLLQDVCDVLGLDFFVTLVDATTSNNITINTIDLSSQPDSFEYIIDTFNGIGTDLSYGQELRNEKTRTMVIGEQQHYLSYVNKFDFFFGVDELTGNPIVPFARDECNNFWIAKSIGSLNLSLIKPFPSNGPYSISELDIRAAMSSYKLWCDRAFDRNSPGTFNQALRALHPDAVTDLASAISTLINASSASNVSVGISDMVQNPRKSSSYSNKYDITDDLQKIHSFIQNLGNTYYGKQYMALLNQTVCYTRSTDGENYSQLVFTDIPTNAGGWVDEGTSVLGLADPSLSFFRQEDNRIGAFADFSVDGTPSAPPSGSSYGNYNNPQMSG